VQWNRLVHRAAALVAALALLLEQHALGQFGQCATDVFDFDLHRHVEIAEMKVLRLAAAARIGSGGWIVMQWCTARVCGRVAGHARASHATATKATAHPTGPASDTAATAHDARGHR
jgi:hypothetical protein